MPRQYRTRSTCSIEHCTALAVGRGWCRKHYGRWKRTGDPRKVTMGPECPRICRICGSNGPFFKTGRICKKCNGARGAKWRSNHAARERENNRRSARECHRRNRAAVVAAYGGHCACCGERELVFLAIDHKEGGGSTHRRSLTRNGEICGSYNFYGWLVRNGFPPGFQVLCHNCNFAKSHGGCPHAARKKSRGVPLVPQSPATLRLPNWAQRESLSREDVLCIAADAVVDPRTAQRYLSGGTVKTTSRLAIERILQKRG